MYLSIFYTLILQVNPFHVGILLLITKIWDAVNDPIIGALVDSRKATKGGKFIPWIRAFSFPMAVLCVLAFVCLLYTSIPLATNIATAEVLIHGLERGDLDWRDIVHPQN